MNGTSGTPSKFPSRDALSRAVPFVVFGAVLALTVVLWRDHVGGAVIVGQVEAVRATVSTPKAGTVTVIRATLHQRVKQGDVLAEVVPTAVDAQIAELAARLELLRAQMGASVERDNVNYQQLRLDLLRRNVDLASARVDLQLAEAEYLRYIPLHATHVISDSEFDGKRSARDALKEKVDALVKLAASLEQDLVDLKPKTGAESPVDRAISAAVLAQQKQLEALAAGASLKAPIDGVVTQVLKKVGENAIDGELVIEIASERATRIIAYLRQPLNMPLKAGDMVDVGSRAGGREKARAKVLSVGPQLEPILPALLPPSSTQMHVIELGLPLVVELPADLRVMPGEIVSIAARN